MNDFCAAWSPRLLSVLRIVSALLILQFGLSKLFGFPFLDGLSNQPTFSLYWFAAIIELVGGALMLVGLRTRCAAFVLSGEMAVAYFIEHAPHNFFPLLNDGNLAVLFCFTFLYFAVAGGGAWSVDALRKNHRG